MLWLSLDLASPTGSLALHRKNEDGSLQLVAETQIGRGSHPLEQLLPVLHTTLSSHGFVLSDIQRFLTTTGPGSFSGLRVAYATLKGFAMAQGTPIDTVSGNEARALAWLREGHTLEEGEVLFVATPVSQGRYCLAAYEAVSRDKVTKLSEDMVPEAEVQTARGRGVVLDASFPLRAAHLAEGIENAVSRRTHTNLIEWINAGPQYLGETKYREVSP